MKAPTELVQLKAAMEARTGNYVDLRDLLACRDILRYVPRTSYRAR